MNWLASCAAGKSFSIGPTKSRVGSWFWFMTLSFPYSVRSRPSSFLHRHCESCSGLWRYNQNHWENRQTYKSAQFFSSPYVFFLLFLVFYLLSVIIIEATYASGPLAYSSYTANIWAPIRIIMGWYVHACTTNRRRKTMLALKLPSPIRRAGECQAAVIVGPFGHKKNASQAWRGI